MESVVGDKSFGSYVLKTRPHFRWLFSQAEKVRIPASRAAVVRTDFRILALLDGYRLVVASCLKNVDIRPENPLHRDGSRYVGSLEDDTPLHVLVVNNNSFDIEFNRYEEFGIIGVETEEGWVESKVRPTTPRRALISVDNAVLPDDTEALFERYHMEDFKCTTLNTEFFRKECLPEVFAVLQRTGWPFNSHADGDFAVAEISECIDLEKLDPLPNGCDHHYSDSAECCLLDLLYWLDIEENFPTT